MSCIPRPRPALQHGCLLTRGRLSAGGGQHGNGQGRDAARLGRQVRDPGEAVDQRQGRLHEFERVGGPVGRGEGVVQAEPQHLVAAAERGIKQLNLAAEVVVDAGTRDADGGADVGEPHGGVAPLPEEPDRRAEQCLAPVRRNEPGRVAGDRDGWLHTGDLAVRDSDGYITLVDRLKDMIISGGRNVYSVEVEAALAGHPDVLDIAVIGIPHPDYGESILAVIVPAPGSQPALESLRTWARDRIAHHKAPHAMVIHDIPRTSSGKIRKHVLRAQLADEGIVAQPAR
jgi:acyl-CoA synthetase (AMP-forming)/AMP-acid ligase II